MMAAAGPQDKNDRNQENRQGENNKRYYDKSHKDYHTWDGNEDRQYPALPDRSPREAFVLPVEPPAAGGLLELAPQQSRCQVRE
jgi:hypothetical protein